MSVAQTYAYFHAHLNYVRERYPEVLAEGYAWIWRLFDVVILDEVHTLGLEASFQDFAPVIIDMIRWLARHKADYPDKRVVFMSGTPAPILATLKGICGKINCYNVLDVCARVKPERIMFVDSRDKMRMIGQLCADGHKVIDFYNGVVRTIGECVNGSAIQYDDILSLTSKWSDTRRIWKESNLWNQTHTVELMEKAEEYMVANDCLPVEYKYICATSAYAEAVTWNNEDIDYMFVDSHIGARVVQCAGRLRKAKFTLVIVVDAYQYDDSLEYSLENCLLDKNVDAHEESDGIYYDYLTDEYKYNQMREDSLRYQLAQIREWNNIDKRKLDCYHSLVRKWFGKDIQIERYNSREHQSYKAMFSDFQIKVNGYYKESKVQDLTKQLNEIWGESHRINTYLKRFVPEYEFVKERYGKHKGKYLLRKKK